MLTAIPTTGRVREVRERLFADGAVVARADGGRRELFPVAIGIEEGLALREWVRKEEALRTLPRLLADGRRFDLAFLDGNHRFEGVFLDLIYAGRLLEEGSIVFVDDTQLAGVRRAVNFCVANLDWIVQDEGEEGDFHEWMVLRTGPTDMFLRPFTQFADF